MPTNKLPSIFGLPNGASIRRLSLALLIGALGGAVFAWLDLPLPWMLGSMAATMCASLLGASIALPQPVRKPMIGVIGVILGSTFTEDRVSDLFVWLPSIAMLPIYVLALGGMILLYLRQISGFDHKTAFFAATPGGLSEMVILSDQLGGDMRNVALFHSARLVLIVFSIPLLASYLVTADPNLSLGNRHNEIRPLELLGLATIGLAGFALAKPLRLPAPSFMGPLLASTVAHLSGLVSLNPPIFLLATAQLVIGSSVGARFSGVPLSLIARTLSIGGGGALIMFVLTFFFAALLQQLTGHPLTLLLLALMPGGFPEMSLIALAMGLDPAFVVTHHGVRVMLVVVFTLPIFTWLSRCGWFARHWPS